MDAELLTAARRREEEGRNGPGKRHRGCGAPGRAPIPGKEESADDGWQGKGAGTPTRQAAQPPRTQPPVVLVPAELPRAPSRYGRPRRQGLATNGRGHLAAQDGDLARATAGAQPCLDLPSWRAAKTLGSGFSRHMQREPAMEADGTPKPCGTVLSGARAWGAAAEVPQSSFITPRSRSGGANSGLARHQTEVAAAPGWP